MTYQKTEVLLKAENVGLSYAGKIILRDVNFTMHNIVRPDVCQGQVVSLIGRSGIGKTQLFKILAGMNKPTTGVVLIGEDMHEVREGEVGVVSQNYILFNHRSIKRNLEIALEHNDKNYTDADKKNIIKDYAEKFNLAEHLDKYPLQLSGGQRQRVSILQQALTSNKFILLDEPFSGLDVLVIDKVVDLLLKVSTLHELNTLIIVSHDIENSLAISDTVFIMANQPNKEGATITEKLDLIEMGMAWNPEIKNDHKFQEMVAHMKYKI
ncbi:MAG: ABC transporter ATP-binding protein [Ferruginibacter sp.]|nr:ABC transporter ATP-binding protein [Ferruginibacter sp.]